MDTAKFKDLKIGQTFVFSNFESEPPVPDNGPFVKVSTRKYKMHTTPFGSDDEARAHAEWNDHDMEVGTINAVVRITPRGMFSAGF